MLLAFNAAVNPVFKAACNAVSRDWCSCVCVYLWVWVLVFIQLLMKFFILLPMYSEKSAGIVALHRLAAALRGQGEQVHKIFFDPHKLPALWISGDGEKWLQCVRPTLPGILRAEAQAVVIVPEVLGAEWFVGLNVARYYLNKLEVLVPGAKAAPGEYKIGFSRLFCSEPDFYLPQYLGKVGLDKAAALKLTPRSLNLTYIGKGPQFIKSPQLVSNTLLLKRDWPDNTAEYLYLLKNSNLIFSYDPISGTLTDAVLMGVIPVLLTYLPFTLDEIETFEHYPPFVKPEGQNLRLDRALFNEERLRFIEDYREDEQRFVPRVRQLAEELKNYFKIHG